MDIIKNGKSYLTLDDLKKYSIWKFSDIDDLTYPVTCAADFPGDDYDLRIRTKFITPSGIELLGCISGVQDIFVVAIYLHDKIFYFNRNSPKDYAKDLSAMSKLLGKNLTLSNFSPLKYTTDIDLEGLGNLEGEFDLLKKRTNEERLKRFEGKT